MLLHTGNVPSNKFAAIRTKPASAGCIIALLVRAENLFGAGGLRRYSREFIRRHQEAV
jgi:hypothetical protein